MTNIVCPKCKGEEFIVRVFVDLNINPNTNFGNIKYDWIEKCTCDNLSCGYDLKKEETYELQLIMIRVAKRLLKAMQAETLLIK